MTTTTRTLRHPTPGDADAVLAVLIADDLHEVGRVDVDETDIAGWWALPHHDPATDAWLLEADGAAVGYGHVMESGESGRHECDSWVADEHDHSGWLQLMAVVEQRARELSEQRGRERCELIGWSVMGRKARAGWFTDLGFTQVRRFYRMEADLDDSARVAPEPPVGVTLERVGAREDVQRDYHQMMQAAFAEHWGFEPCDFHTWIARVTASPNLDWDTVWLARVDGEPAAGLKMRLHSDVAWVDTIGTLATYRGRGLASLLLRTAFAESLARGQAHVELGVDTENATGAVAIYERVGMSVAFAHDEWRRPLA